jgi:hypothetical protein
MVEEVELRVTNGGTMATPVLLDIRSTTTPLGGAGPESVIVKVPVVPSPTIVSGEGEAERVKPTFTVEVADGRLVLETVIDVVPAATPVTVTAAFEVVWPAVTEISEAETVAMLVLFETTDNKTVLVAGFTRLMGNDTVFPGVTVTLEGTLIPTTLVTVTAAVAVVTLGLAA